MFNPRARTCRLPGVALVAVLLTLAAVLVPTTATATAAPVGPGQEVLTDPCAPAAVLPAGEARCYAVERTRVVPDGRGAATAAPASATPTGGITPAQLQRAYGVTGLAAPAGTTVGVVVAYDTPTVEADLARFRAQYGLPACTTANRCFRKVDQRGVTVPAGKSTSSTTKPVYNAGWQLETTLDTQAVSAMCPSCSILLVEADDFSLTNSLGPAVLRAQTLGATVISNSFGSGESQDEVRADATYWSQATVPVFAASGDAAHADAYGSGHYPAVSPSVTTVGGTSAQLVNGAISSESAWYAPSTHAGSGSGCSVVFDRPDYQSAYFSARAMDPYPFVSAPLYGCNIPGKGTTPARAYSDLSALADPYAPGFPVYLQGGWTVAGGTSLAVQLVAALAAYAGPRGDSTSVNRVAYGLAQRRAPTGLADVVTGSTKVSGDNCGSSRICNAGTDWDGPTGLGTPRGLSVFAPLLTLSPATSVPGGTVTASGSNFVPGENVLIRAPDGTILNGTFVRADGTYSMAVVLPARAASPLVLRVTGPTSGFTASRTITLSRPALNAVAAAEPTGQVVPLETVTARLTSFGARERVRLTVTGGAAVTATTTLAGKANVTLTVPVTASGSVTLRAVGAASGSTASTTLPVTAAAVTPVYQVVNPGETVTWQGSGFGSGEAVTVTDDADSSGRVVATATAGVDGSVAPAWTPVDTDLGTHPFTVRGVTTGRSVAVVVDVELPSTRGVH